MSAEISCPACDGDRESHGPLCARIPGSDICEGFSYDKHHALIASLRARAERAEAALSHVVNHCDCVTISPKCGCSTIIQARARAGRAEP